MEMGKLAKEYNILLDGNETSYHLWKTVKCQEIISQNSPHAFSGKRIQLSTRSSIREFCQLQLDVSLENQGVDMLHLVCYWTKSDGTGGGR